MKKLILGSLIIFFSLGAIVYAQNLKSTIEKISITEPQKSLDVGEILQYSVEWLGIPAGRIVLRIEDITEINNRKCYHISGHAIPNKFFRRFYDIEYKVDTYIDIKELYPHRFEKVRRIKDKFSYLVIEFDQGKNKATYIYYTPQGPLEITDFPSLRKEVLANEITTIDVPQKVQDLFSSLYYFRSLKIEEGASYPLYISYARQNWRVNIKIEKPFWKDIYRKGTFAVVEGYPSSDLNNLILGRRKIQVYFTTDSRRIPLIFKLTTAAGPIRGIIQDIPK